MTRTTINHLLKRLTAWLEGFMGQDTAPMLPIAPGAALGDVLTLKWDADDERKERELYLANPLAFWLRPDRHEHGAMCWAVEGVWGDPKQKRREMVKDSRIRVDSEGQMHRLPDDTPSHWSAYNQFASERVPESHTIQTEWRRFPGFPVGAKIRLKNNSPEQCSVRFKLTADSPEKVLSFNEGEEVFFTAGTGDFWFSGRALMPVMTTLDGKHYMAVAEPDASQRRAMTMADEALFLAMRRSAASDVKFKPLSISFPID